MDHFRRRALQEAIRQHLGDHGARQWSLVRNRFLDVPHASFWRAVKSVKDQELSPIADQSDRHGTEEAGDLCFFPPNCEPMKILREYGSLIQQADNLISQAQRDGRIVDWRMYAKGISVRDQLLRQQIQVLDDLVSLGTTELWYAAILDILAQADPSLRNQVIEKYRELTAEGSAEVRKTVLEAYSAAVLSGTGAPRKAA